MIKTMNNLIKPNAGLKPALGWSLPLIRPVPFTLIVKPVTVDKQSCLTL